MDELALHHLHHRAIAFKDVCGTGKSQITFDKVAINDATKYAAEDAEITYRFWKLLKPRLVHERVTTIYETIEPVSYTHLDVYKRQAECSYCGQKFALKH